MTRRTLAAVGLLVVALLAVATVGVAAQSGGTAGNVTSGDYDLSTLRDGGTELENGPASQRFMGEFGSATIRFEPVGPLGQNWEYLEPGTTLHADRVTLRTVRLAPSDQLDRRLNVTVVGWEKGQRPTVENNRTIDRQSAVTQSVYRQQVTLGRGYDEATIRLPESYGNTEMVTMWIEEYPDARWKFQHLSVPSTQQVDIDTAGEAWNYTTRTAVIPGALGVILGLWFSRETLKRTGSGPRWGLTIWLIIAGVLLFGVLSSMYFQVAVVLTFAPWLLGAVMFILAYGGGLWYAGSPATVGFYRVELFDARLGPAEREVEVVGDHLDPDEGEPITDGGTMVNGDAESADEDDQEGEANKGPGSGLEDIKEVRYVDLEELPAIHTPDGDVRVPKRGLRPFLARLFADAAEIDKSDLVTKIEVEQGRLDEIVLVDPEADEVVTHDPAHLERRWPFLEGVDEDADWTTKLGATLGMIALVAGLPAAGWMAGAQVGVPVIGAALAAVPAVLSSYTAVNGEVDFEPASQHFQRAQATLVDLQREQADGKTLEAYREQAWKERARTAQEAVDLAEQHDRTLTEEMLSERAGYNLVEPDEEGDEEPTPDAGGESDDD